MKTVYLDNNATTKVAPEVLEAMLPFFSELYGNPSSMHSFGGQVARHVSRAREQVAAILGADPEEIIFTSCGTESDNAAIRSALAVSPGKKHIVTSRIEHPAIRSLCHHLRKQGYRVTEIPVDAEGRLDMDSYEKSLTSDTAVASLMWANNETGVVFPVEQAARMAHEREILFHTDAVQAVGKIPVDVRDLDVDFLTMSAHKIYGPKGVGALYVKKGVPYCPLILGGHQENGRRAGTENSLGIIGMGKAVEMRAIEMDAEERRLLHLKQTLRDGIEKAIPDVLFMGHPEHGLPGTLSVSFIGAEGESILLYLDLAGIAVSTGSACASGSLDPSHVILATGVPVENAHGSVRISLGRENTMEDVQYMLYHLPPIIDRIRTMSTAYRRR